MPQTSRNNSEDDQLVGAVSGATTPDEDSQTQIPTQFLCPPPPTGRVDTDLPSSLTLISTPVLQTKKARGRPRKSPSPSSTEANAPSTLPKFWCECPDIYPDSCEIAEALQDLGRSQMKVTNGLRQPVTSYPKIQKLCSKIYQKIQLPKSAFDVNPGGGQEKVERVTQIGDILSHIVRAVGDKEKRGKIVRTVTNNVQSPFL